MIRVVIEFYRVRSDDGAHAVLDRAEYDVVDIAAAVRVAEKFILRVELPQRPDDFVITDMTGNPLYRASDQNK